jgi:hypothetical protein
LIKHSPAPVSLTGSALDGRAGTDTSPLSTIATTFGAPCFCTTFARFTLPMLTLRSVAASAAAISREHALDLRDSTAMGQVCGLSHDHRPLALVELPAVQVHP